MSSTKTSHAIMIKPERRMKSFQQSTKHFTASPNRTLLLLAIQTTTVSQKFCNILLHASL